MRNFTSDTQYDKLGRVSSVSNPYRTTSLTDAVNPANLWTTNSYNDPLNRLTAVTTADGASTTTAYGANTTGSFLGTTVTVTDQASRKRQSVTDAQGRVIQIIEDPLGTSYQTNYTYDVLNNLRKVEQGAQLRYFGYDSLSRVIRVRHVEQAVNTSLPAWTDPVTSYSGGWTAGFSYDANGNMSSRTDARNVTTNYTYDSLNRSTTLRYTNDPQNTPGMDLYYDGYRQGTNYNVPNGKGRSYQSETLGQVMFTTDGYDVMGRPLTQRQQFWTGSVWSGPYQVSASYDLAGTLISETYPSGHTISYQVDQAVRMKTFSGNLGDGVARTYANNFQYNEWNALQQEQFGTQTPLYHKQNFNVRGQLWGTRLSTVSFSTDPMNWDRGAVVNYYSNSYVAGGSGADNNGNLLRQESYTPGSNYFQQTYSYDSLNRLKSVSEKLNGSGADTFTQAYLYDQWGNRTIDQGLTTSNVPRPNYTVDANNTNHLIAPAGYTYDYDNAGNQTNDTYTGGGQRTYDGENRMNSAQSGGPWQYYKYSGSGLRVRRIVYNVETWQVYGIDGGLLAEYQGGAASFIPTKEYGYRGGQLLTTITNGDAQRLSRFVYNLYYGALQRDPTAQELTDKMNDLANAGAQGQTQLQSKANEIARNLFASTNYESPARSDTQYVTDLYYAYTQRGPDDSGLGWWTPQAAASVPNRINVLNAFEASGEFQTLVNALYGTSTSDDQRTEHFVNNFYLGAYGVNATATQLQQQRDSLNAAASQGLSQVQAQAETMGRALFAAQVNDGSISNTQYVTNLYEAFLQRGPDAGGLTFWSGGATPGTGRQNVLNAFATCPAFRDLSGTLYREVYWLVADQLGTTRMVVDKSGSLAGIKRHDYLPFGEEIGGPQLALIGGREVTPGYVADSVRQKFTGYESDAETGLNFAQARYQSPIQGRFTSVDPLGASANVGNPQSFNRYSYVLNNPTNLADPTGMTPNNGADRAWSDVADGFWGSSYNPNRSHFGGPAIVAAAEYLQDISVAGSIFKQRKAEQDQKSVSPRPPQKPATVIGPNGEIPGDGDLIVSSIYEGASNATRFNLITEANPIHLVTRLRAEENLPIAGDATFWQAGLGPSSVGIIHQRSRTYYTFGRGLSVPTFSFQMGKYVSSDPIQEGLTPISFSGGAVLVGNFSVVPFFRKAQSTAWGTPQLSLGPSFTFRLDSLDTWSVLRATQMNRSLFQ